jgi:hypothetical protein
MSPRTRRQATAGSGARSRGRERLGWSRGACRGLASHGSSSSACVTPWCARSIRLDQGVGGFSRGYGDCSCLRGLAGEHLPRRDRALRCSRPRNAIGRAASAARRSLNPVSGSGCTGSHMTEPGNPDTRTRPVLATASRAGRRFGNELPVATGTARCRARSWSLGRGGETRVVPVFAHLERVNYMFACELVGREPGERQSGDRQRAGER